MHVQLADLTSKPRLLSPEANRRDVQVLMSRFVIAVPRYLEGVLDRLEQEGRLDSAGYSRVYTDVALLSQMFVRFTADRAGEETQGIRIATFQLRKLIYRTLLRSRGRTGCGGPADDDDALLALAMVGAL